VARKILVQEPSADRLVQVEKGAIR